MVISSEQSFRETTFEITGNVCNAIIGYFNLICFSVALAGLFRQIPQEDLIAEGQLIWNGHIATLCYNASVSTTSFLSVLKRLELEPYTKMAFRFALMFPATCRAFHAFIRYKHFEFKTLKGNPKADGLILMIVYKLAPVFLCFQMFFAAATLILNGFIDKDALPGMLNRCMILLICFSASYMATVLVIDSRESNWNIFKHLSIPRFTVRLICATAFFTCVFPTYRNYLYYIRERQCTFLASTPLSAMTEYLTIIGISGFHFSELFDLDLIHFTVVETVST